LWGGFLWRTYVFFRAQSNHVRALCGTSPWVPASPLSLSTKLRVVSSRLAHYGTLCSLTFPAEFLSLPFLSVSHRGMQLSVPVACPSHHGRFSRCPCFPQLLKRSGVTGNSNDCVVPAGGSAFFMGGSPFPPTLFNLPSEFPSIWHGIPARCLFYLFLLFSTHDPRRFHYRGPSLFSSSLWVFFPFGPPFFSGVQNFSKVVFSRHLFRTKLSENGLMFSPRSFHFAPFWRRFKPEIFNFSPLAGHFGQRLRILILPFLIFPYWFLFFFFCFFSRRDLEIFCT